LYAKLLHVASDVGLVPWPDETKIADFKADIEAEDRGELVSVMEPLLVRGGSRRRGALTDLALELTQKSASFRRSLPPFLLSSLADLVRAMNCYYSNLIEGLHTLWTSSGR